MSRLNCTPLSDTGNRKTQHLKSNFDPCSRRVSESPYRWEQIPLVLKVTRRSGMGESGEGRASGERGHLHSDTELWTRRPVSSRREQWVRPASRSVGQMPVQTSQMSMVTLDRVLRLGQVAVTGSQEREQRLRTCFWGLAWSLVSFFHFILPHSGRDRMGQARLHVLPRSAQLIPAPVPWHCWYVEG